MLRRLMMSLAFVVLAVVVVKSLPDIARYLRIRAL